ncbi:MAG: LPS assembly lipoprotein LptE [Pseudomonadota bacterium]
MSWFKTTLLCLMLAACGFSPVYGPGGSGAALQNRIVVDPPRDREGFILVRQLEDRLGRPSSAVYRLAVAIEIGQENRAIDPDGDIRRLHLVGAADYTLFDTASGATVAEGSVDSFVGYSATGTTVATLAARRDAQNRLMTILADDIVRRLQAAPL